jgi:hypothetical protein
LVPSALLLLLLRRCELEDAGGDNQNAAAETTCGSRRMAVLRRTHGWTGKEAFSELSSDM